jgi:hypothetical protein
MSYRLATTDTEAPGARLFDNPPLLFGRPLASTSTPIAHHPSLTLVSTNSVGGHHHAKT